MAFRSTSTVSRNSSSDAPSNQGVRSLRVMTLSPCSALIGIGCRLGVGQDPVELVDDVLEHRAVEVDQIHLVDGEDVVVDAEQPRDLRVPARLRAHAVAGVDQQNRDVGRRRAGRHVARVLLVPGRVGEDELPPRGGEIAVGDVDRDPLLALGLQAVGEQREIDRPGGAVPRRLLDRVHLILVDRARVVQQPPDQRALPVVHAAGGADAQQPRHQKYPSRFFSSIDPS